jgi:ankyrin repeat protein
LLATDKDGRTSLHRAAFAGRARTVKLLVGHAKKQKNGIARSLLLAGTREGRCTALQYAAWKGYPKVCDIILGTAQEIGLLESLLAAKDAHGNDALRRAEQSNCTETLSILFMYEDRASMGH